MRKIMIYTKTRKIEMREILNELKINANIIMLAGFLVCGVIIGSGLIFLSDYSFGMFLDRFVYNYIVDYSNFFSLFLRELLIAVIFIFPAFFFGLSCVGTPVICILPVFEGVFFGLIFSSFLFRNEIKGIFSSCLCILPGVSILAAVSLIAYSTAYDMSSRLSKEIFSNSKISKNLKSYSYEFIIIFCISLFSALISTMTKLIFVG